MINKIWQEKYRPSTVKNIISIHTNSILKSMEQPLSMQNYLFYSRVGGTGKTSMAKAIINDLSCDYLMLNASEERSIDIVRTKVKDFCCAKSSNANSKKCVWMDEAEKLTKDAMDALKNMIETYSNNAFFIFTTNDLKKINQPMQSRFNVMNFSAPDKNDIKTYVISIILKEEITYDDDGLNKMIDAYYPSIRKMVNFLQELKLQNKSLTMSNVSQPLGNIVSLFSLIKQQNYSEIKKLIIENGVDVQELNTEFFDAIISKKLEVSLKQEIKLIKILAKNELDFAMGADKNIVFLASVPDMIVIANGE